MNVDYEMQIMKIRSCCVNQMWTNAPKALTTALELASMRWGRSVAWTESPSAAALDSATTPRLENAKVRQQIFFVQ